MSMYDPDWMTPTRDEDTSRAESQASEAAESPEPKRPARKRTPRRAPKKLSTHDVATVIATFEHVSTFPDHVRDMAGQIAGSESDPTSLVTSMVTKHIDTEAYQQIVNLVDADETTIVYGILGVSDEVRKTMWNVLKSLTAVSGGLPQNLATVTRSMVAGINNLHRDTVTTIREALDLLTVGGEK